MNEKEMYEMINVNMIATIFMSKSVIRNMLKNKGPCSITTIGSIVGETGNPGQSIYSATKSSLIGFTKSLSKEIGPRGIRVNLIQPGFIETEMTKDIKKEEILKKITLGKFGQTKDISSAIEFCIENEYITGQILTIDGGLNL
jgi:3-oxoacyl-[acyl-carrier protein] reductase